MNQSFFLPTFFHSALAILEPQIYIVVEQFRAENITLLSGRLVIGNMNIQKHHLHVIIRIFFRPYFIWERKKIIIFRPYFIWERKIYKSNVFLKNL